jgi:hypothetical protein
MFGALAWAELAFSAAVKEQAHRFEAAGGTVAVIDGPDGLDAAACEEMRWDPRSVAAGGVRGAGQIGATSAPGTFFERWEVTGDAVTVWDPGFASPLRQGYVAGRAAAAELGLVDGGWLLVDAQESAPVAVADPAMRNRFAGRAILEPVAPSGRLSQCWMEFEPDYFEAGLRWLPAQFAPDQVQARRAVSRGEFGVDPAELLAGRPQRWAWLPIGVIGAAMFTLVAFFRRSETALYRAFGLPSRGLLIMHQLEAVIVVAAALLISFLWATVAHSLTDALPDPDQLALALRSTLLAGALVSVVGPLGARLAGTGSPATLLKER